eukprot:494593_1
MTAQLSHDYKCFKEHSLLDDIPIGQSIKRALVESRNSAQQIQFVGSVIKYLHGILNQTNPEQDTLNVLDKNLQCLFEMFGSFDDHLKFKPNRPGHHSSMQARQNQEMPFIQGGLHALLSEIIQKYSDIPPNEQDDVHTRCLYYSLRLVATMHMTHNIVPTAEDPVLQTTMSILKHDKLSWLEQFDCARFVALMTVNSNPNQPEIWLDLLHKHGLNVFELLIKTCCNCFKLQYYDASLSDFHRNILSTFEFKCEDPSQYQDQSDIPTYKPSQYSRSNQVRRNIAYQASICRTALLSTLRIIALNFRNNSLAIDAFFQNLDSNYLRRLLQISTLYMREGSPGWPLTINSIDTLVLLVPHRSIAQQMVNDEDIITNLIISLRSRGRCCEFNYREIVVLLFYIIVEHQLLPKVFENDAIFAFVDLLEDHRKNLSLSRITTLPTLSNLIVQTLKCLFEIKTYQRHNSDEYLCGICQNEYDFPHTIPCGHSMCYNCLTPLLRSKLTMAERHVLSTVPFKDHQCPLCRKTFHGSFDRSDKHSAFVLDVELLNKMNSEPIVFVKEENEDVDEEEFKGTEHDYWVHLQQSNDTCSKTSVAFAEFCDFMIKKSKTYPIGNVKKEKRNDILLAQSVKKAANALFKERKYDDAIAKYKECLSICPLWHADRAIYYSNLGLCYSKLSDWANAYRCALRGLSMNPLNVKLLNSGFTALEKMLNNETNVFIEHGLHDAIDWKGNNRQSLHRRVYDVLLHQMLWDCQFWYINKVSTCTQRDSVAQAEHSTKMQKEDPFLVRINNAMYAIDAFEPMNYDDMQYEEYVMETQLVTLKNVRDLMVETVLDTKEKISLDQILQTISNDEIDKQDLIRIAQQSKVMTLDDGNWIQIGDNDEALQIYHQLKQKDEIVNAQILKERLTAFCNVYIAKMTQNSIDRLVEKYKDKPIEFMNEVEQDHILRRFVNWNKQNYDLIHIPLYIWEKGNI